MTAIVYKKSGIRSGIAGPDTGLSKNLADFFDKLKRGLFYSRPLFKLRLYFS